jgi:hypothetical protein
MALCKLDVVLMSWLIIIFLFWVLTIYIWNGILRPSFLDKVQTELSVLIKRTREDFVNNHIPDEVYASLERCFSVVHSHMPDLGFGSFLFYKKVDRPRDFDVIDSFDSSLLVDIYDFVFMMFIINCGVYYVFLFPLSKKRIKGRVENMFWSQVGVYDDVNDGKEE